MRKETYAFLSLFLVMICCREKPEKVSPAIINTQPEVVIDEGIVGNKKLDSEFRHFASDLARRDSVKLFSIFFARKPEAVRVTIFPLRFLDHSDICPVTITAWSGYSFLLYTGEELLRPVNDSVAKHFSTLQKQFGTRRPGVYDGAVLQFDVFSPDSIQRVLPAEDFYGKPPKTIEFKP